jgi:predicted hydrocarbon binding protein
LSLESDGRGRLTFRGAPFILIRPETLVALQRAMEVALGPRAASCLAAGGRAGGARATLTLPGDDVRARVEALLAMGAEIGWGLFSLERLTATELVVTVERSPFAETYGKASASVCHLTRGVLESLAVTALGGPATVLETACAATGAERCRFEARAARAPGG